MDQRVASSEAPWHRMSEMPTVPNAPDGVDARYVTGDQLQVIEARIAGGSGLSPIPAHSHANEQLTYVISGQVRAKLSGREVVANPGDALLIPGGMEHAVTFVGDVHLLEVFSPPRFGNAGS